jgi:peptide/nickel transport system permease protein
MSRNQDTLIRFLRFAVKRALSLLLVVIVGVWFTILITSNSVVLDQEFAENPSPISGWFSGVANPVVRPRPPGVSTGGLSPFQTSIRLLVPGLLLNFGNTNVGYSFGGGASFNNVRLLIADSLPRTLLLFGSANLLIFFSSLSLALMLTRAYGSRLEKFVLALSPISTIPAWIYGVVIVVVLAKGFSFYQGGMLNAWPDEWSWDFVVRLLRFMVPAIVAVFLSKFFQSVYSWRSFLLIFSGEDYLELARAKGLPNRIIERRYLLKPAMPNILTSFTMMLIAIWQEAIIIELFFNVRGIGHVFYNAIRYKDMAVIVGLTVIFAYLLAASVLILDIISGIIDPRVRLTESSQPGRLVRGGREKLSFQRLAWRRAAPVPEAWKPEKSRSSLSSDLRSLAKQMRASLRRIRESLPLLAAEMRRYPSAVLGFLVILSLVGLSFYTLIKYPYSDAVRTWNFSGHISQTIPSTAAPAWTNLFRRDTQPESIIINTRGDQVLMTSTQMENGWTETVTVFPFDYPYRGFPKNLHIVVYPNFSEKSPHISLLWRTPDGREYAFGDFSSPRTERIPFTENRRLMRQLGGQSPQEGLFADPQAEELRALPGQYELIMTALMFEENSGVDAEFQLEGRVYGLSGTDHRRRDLTLALMWGAPVALAFGFLGAFGTTVTTMVVAGISAWFGGWADSLIQRLTEVNMILPAFPILLIVYNFYWKSFWGILGVAVLLGIFSGAIKTYRSIFLTAKDAPYIEAARAYGSSSWRIIFRYLVPRILPVIIPQLIILIPTYVYLEATLAFLNMSDPLLPTWGKVIREGISNGALEGAYHWLLMPAGILTLTGLAFLMVGYAFERVLNPRLRDY